MFLLTEPFCTQEHPLGLPKSNAITQEQSIALVSCCVRLQTIRTMPICDCIMNHTQDYKAVTGDFQEVIYCSDQNSSTVETSDHRHAIFLAMALCSTYWSTCGIPLHMWRGTRCRAKPIIFQLKVVSIDLTGLMTWHKYNLRSQGQISYLILTWKKGSSHQCKLSQDLKVISNDNLEGTATLPVTEFG